MTLSTRTGENMVPVLYCDIDGTIRHGYDELGHFVNKAEDVRVFDGVADLLWSYKARGWRIVGISNQGGVALGYMSMEDCIKQMAETNKQTRYAFDKIAFCTHHPDAKGLENAICWCRKPRPGLIIETAMVLAEQKEEIYPAHMALVVGDRPEDAACAENAGLRFMEADVWRTGFHLKQLAQDAFVEAREESVAKSPVSLASTFANMGRNGTDLEDPLPDDILEWAIGVTGAKVKKVAVETLEVGNEFVFAGRLYTLTQKNPDFVKGERGEAWIIFYNPLAKGVPLDWDIEVLTDDNA